jgi:hypothetical protein
MPSGAGLHLNVSANTHLAESSSYVVPFCIVVDILGHIRVQRRKGGSIGWVSASTWDLVIWNTSEFVVLHPEVGLQYLGCCCEQVSAKRQSFVISQLWLLALVRAIVALHYKRISTLSVQG